MHAIQKAGLALFILALPSVAMAEAVPQDSDECAPIPARAITTSFDTLPKPLQEVLAKRQNFSSTNSACAPETTTPSHWSACFERAAFFHDEWIVILHYPMHPPGTGFASVWKIAGDTITEVGWVRSYPSLCTLQQFGMWIGHDKFFFSKEEGKPAVRGATP